MSIWLTKSTYCVFLIKKKNSNIRKGDFLVDTCKPIRFSRHVLDILYIQKKNKRFFFVWHVNNSLWADKIFYFRNFFFFRFFFSFYLIKFVELVPIAHSQYLITSSNVLFFFMSISTWWWPTVCLSQIF